MLRIVYTGLLLAALCRPAAAEELVIGDDLVISLAVPAGWTLQTVPPDALVAETAAHLAHEAEARGKHPGPEQLRRLARQRLAANEAILYHPGSGAHFDIDVSRRAQGEAVPMAETLKKSAEFALKSLKGEEGVAEAAARIRTVPVPGGGTAYRLDVVYRQHAEPVAFIGVIGYVPDSWYFFYCTAPGRDPQILAQAEQIFDSLAMHRVRP